METLKQWQPVKSIVSLDQWQEFSRWDHSKAMDYNLVKTASRIKINS